MNTRVRGTIAFTFATIVAVMSIDAQAQSGSRTYRSRTIPQSTSRTTVRRTPQVTPQQTGFALVELFTSEGCSSCPSADANLARLVDEAKRKGLPIYALSFHVDYWNRLGWTDPYSSKEFSQRQRTYAASMDSDRVYTPQMIVNGKVEFVGSNKTLTAKAINSEIQKLAKVDVHTQVRGISGQNVTVSLKLAGGTGVDHVNIALVQKAGQQRASSGENRNRTLKHVNIVRDFVTVRPSSREVKLTIPKGMSAKDFRVIAYAQNKKREVLGATSTLVASR